MSIDFRPGVAGIGWDDPLNLNVANGNAAKILEILGLPTWMAEGEIEPADLKARILVARLADDGGEPDTEDPRLSGARMIHCGLPAGYFRDRLDILDKIADYSLNIGAKVVWY